MKVKLARVMAMADRELLWALDPLFTATIKMDPKMKVDALPEVLVLRNTNCSLWHVLQQYVSLTSKQVPPVGPLLVTLKRPFTGLA